MTPKRTTFLLSRETTPVAMGDEVFLPDFTVRRSDGREALIEIVAVGGALDTLTSPAGTDRLVWFTDRPRASDVVHAAEQGAR